MDGRDLIQEEENFLDEEVSIKFLVKGFPIRVICFEIEKKH